MPRELIMKAQLLILVY